MDVQIFAGGYPAFDEVTAYLSSAGPDFTLLNYTRGGGQLPIAIDLDGNGIDYVRLLDSTVYLDGNDDGVADKTAWVGAGDGFLAIDLNHDGIVNGFSELNFAQFHPAASTDLEGLALAFDSNADGIFSAADTHWNLFNIWQDKNQNGISEAGEMHSLNEMGIREINLSSDHVEHSEGDVIVFGAGNVEFNDGSKTVFEDIALLYETENSADELVSQLLASATAEIDTSVTNVPTSVEAYVQETLSQLAQTAAIESAAHEGDYLVPDIIMQDMDFDDDVLQALM